MTITGDPHHDRLEAVVDQYLAVWQTGDPERLGDLADLVTDDARFRDPFHDVRGRDQVIGVLQASYARITNVHIGVHARARDDLVTLIQWTFRFRTKRRGQPWLLEGMSELHQHTESGLIEAHLDHWDPAGQIYETVPVLGPLIRLARRRVAGG